MVKISLRKCVVAMLRNFFHCVQGGPCIGGHRTTIWSAEQRRVHATRIFDTLSPHFGNLLNSKGLEVGPGDNLEVCQLCVEAGCEKIFAVERYSLPQTHEDRITFIRLPIEELELTEKVDFAYSNDVFEHVTDVPMTMKTIFSSLRPGGRFINSIDLRGHNAFSNPQRPLDFLTCPDWLYVLMSSHIVTANRVRVHEFVQAAVAAGFTVLKSEALEMADALHLQEIQPYLLPRYQNLPVSELRTLQLLLVLEKPVEEGTRRFLAIPAYRASNHHPVFMKRFRKLT